MIEHIIVYGTLGVILVVGFFACWLVVEAKSAEKHRRKG